MHYCLLHIIIIIYTHSCTHTCTQSHTHTQSESSSSSLLSSEEDPDPSTFEVGMKLEAVDRRFPYFVCVATIMDRTGMQCMYMYLYITP